MATKTTISLKFLVDNTSKRVIFAEAGKDFVDFLFGLLELPLGTLVKLLAEEEMASSWTLGKVYESVENLKADYLQPHQTKQVLLYPSKPSSKTKSTTHLMQKLGYGMPESSSHSGYRSSDYEIHIEEDDSEFYSDSGYRSRDDKTDVDGYVKGTATYMISDDLTVKPLSRVSCISLINSLAVKDVGSLEEKNVEIDMKKALELVKTSFESNTVLTDVFVGKTSPSPTPQFSSHPTIPVPPNVSTSLSMGCDSAVIEQLKIVVDNLVKVMGKQSILEEKFGQLHRSQCDLIEKLTSKSA